MNVSTMRRLDHWVGVPVCALLTGLRRLGDLVAKARARRPRPVRKVAFLKLAEQGSTVLAFPALEAAVAEYGQENVYFLVFEENRFVLDAMEIVRPENVISIRNGGILPTLVNVVGAVARMRREGIDATVDLEFFARATAILGFLGGARVRAGLHAFAGDGPYRGDLMTHRVIYNPHVHTSQMFLLQVQALQQDSSTFPAFARTPTPFGELSIGHFEAPGEEVRQVREKLRELTGNDSVPPLVLLNANCGDLLPLRRWDEASFVALAHRFLDADPGLWIAFTGAPNEAASIERLVERVHSPRCISLAGHTSLRELLVVYGLAELLITNDSGPAHFATLTDIDVLCLFGPETPELFGSLSARSHALWAGTACSPCVSAYNNRVSRCRDNVCMQRIGADEVFAKATEVLEARRAAQDDGGNWLIPARQRARSVVLPRTREHRTGAEASPLAARSTDDSER